MNKIKYITMAAMAAILITSCEKEEGINPGQTSVNSNDSDKKAENIMSSAYEKIGAMGKSLLISKIDEAKLSLDSKLNSDKSGEPILLEDIFTIYEAAINGTFPSGEAQDGGETYESSFTVPVTEDGGNYYVSETDFASFYLALQADMNNELDPNSNEYFGLADLTLQAINSTSATISVHFVIRTSVPMFAAPTPGGSVYGALLAGWCSVNLPGIDASVFLRGHVNSQSQYYSYPPLASRYIIIQDQYHTLDYSKHLALGINSGFIQSSIWRSPVNSCVGDDSDQSIHDQIWYNHFDNMDEYVDMPLARLQNTYGGNLTIFLYTDFKSVDNRALNRTDAYAFGRYHHEGTFYYGLCVVC